MKESAKQRPRGTICPVQRAVGVKSDSLGELVYWEDGGTGGERRPVWLEEARDGEAVTEVNQDEAEHHPFLSYSEITEKQALKLSAQHTGWPSAMLSCSVVSDSYNPIDCSLPGSSVHGILQARILEWASISFSKGSSQHGGRTQVSGTAVRLFTD